MLGGLGVTDGRLHVPSLRPLRTALKSLGMLTRVSAIGDRQAAIDFRSAIDDPMAIADRRLTIADTSYRSCVGVYDTGRSSVKVPLKMSVRAKPSMSRPTGRPR